jgi:UDP-N-acetyl-D-mannosaminuronate dehydrogenase
LRTARRGQPHIRQLTDLGSKKKPPCWEATALVTDHDSIDYVALADSARLVVDTRNACARAGAVGAHIVKA